MNQIKKIEPFHFKEFTIEQDQCAMKVGTDGVLLGAWVNLEEVSSILDIGTGTGLIAIMLAQRTQKTKIDAVEIDAAAQKQASENMKNSPWSDRLEAHCIAIQDYVRQINQTYDLIVSNPPFFSGGTFSKDQNRNNVRHTIKLPSGDLLSAARRLLNPNGKFCVILPFLEGLRFEEMARNYNLYCTKITEVQPTAEKGVERLLLQFEKEKKSPEKEELIIQHKQRNHFTDDYISLTRAFYLNV